MDGLILSDDLLFISRVQGEARAHDLACASVRSAEQLMEKASATQPRGVLLDLHLVGQELPTVMSRLKALSPAPFVVGYGSHVDAATLHQARRAGCDLVLPRSQFVEELPSQLPAWLRSES